MKNSPLDLPSMLKGTSRPGQGKIHIADGPVIANVKIWDIWDEGAGLELPDDIMVPSEFSLEFSANGLVTRVKLRLQTGRLVRVAFAEPPR